MHYMNKKRSPIWKISKEDLISLIEKSQTLTEVLAFFGLRNIGSNYRTLKARLEYDGISDKKLKYNRKQVVINREKIQNDKIFIENSTYSRYNMKKRIRQENLIPYQCDKCGIGSVWNDEELVLQLDHINGVGDDNRIENLRFLCPNCHSQTITFAGRSLKKIINKDIHEDFQKKDIIYKEPKKKRDYSKRYDTCECGNKKCSKSILCIECNNRSPKLNRRKIVRPSYDELENLLKNNTFVDIGKMFGVSDNAVRKWRKYYITERGKGSAPML